MPPSRRNLVIICCLCLVTIYIAASVRVYNSASGRSAWNPGNYISIPYAPYVLPGPEKSFFDKTASKKTESKPVIAQARVELTGPAVPVTAQAYLVGDLSSGKILLEKNGKSVLPVASMSKLITAFVATETIKPDTVITISEENVKLPPDTSRILAGEQMTLEELLYPLLLSSSNSVAEALASAVNRVDFLELMSSYAWEVGMPSSFFADASGLDPKNAASARDLFALAQYLHTAREDILRITRTPESSIGTSTGHGAHVFTSTHPFVSDPNFLGGKTGRTPEAGETMMTLMTVNGKAIAVIVLGSQFGQREGDTRLLLEQAGR